MVNGSDTSRGVDAFEGPPDFRHNACIDRLFHLVPMVEISADHAFANDYVMLIEFVVSRLADQFHDVRHSSVAPLNQFQAVLAT